MNDISNGLQIIVANFKKENYRAVVQQAVQFIQEKLREVIKRDLTQLQNLAQLTVMKHLAAKNKAIDELTFSELVELLAETQFFMAWKHLFQKDIRVFETIDLNKLTNLLQNGEIHNTPPDLMRGDAELLITYCHIIVQTFEPAAPKPSPELKSWVNGRKKSVIVMILMVLLSLWGTVVLLKNLWFPTPSSEIIQLTNRAKLGENEAQLELGYAYALGKQVNQDYLKSKDFFEQAAAQENPEAMTALGIIYLLARGVAQDYVTARELFEKAMARDYPLALQCLAKMYQEGLGVAKDEKRAEELLNQFSKSLQTTPRIIAEKSSLRMFVFEGYQALITYNKQLSQSLASQSSAAVSPSAPQMSTVTEELPFTGCDAVTTIPQKECETLVKFYHSTRGDNWENNRGWLKLGDPCRWIHVACEQGRVITIGTTNLVRESATLGHLKGSIPDLSALSELQHLGLYNNQLSGTIPDLSSLKKLKLLDLSNNQLTGTLPNLSQLQKLEMLHLGNNHFSGTIPELSHLRELRELYLDKNQLHGTIPDLSQLNKLETLCLGGNQLTGNIPELSQLSKLERLELNHNQLTGAIPELSQLNELKYLRLYYNQLSGSIPNISRLKELRGLWLNNNQLSGVIPDLSRLENLIIFDISANSLCRDSSIHQPPKWKTEVYRYPLCPAQ